MTILHVQNLSDPVFNESIVLIVVHLDVFEITKQEVEK